MKQLSAILCALALVFGVVGSVGALPIYFDVAGDPASSVNLTNVNTLLGTTGVSAQLVDGLDGVTFTLGDGDSRTFDFFTLTVSGFGVGSADVAAKLAFDDPQGAEVSGSGSGGWLTWFGVISGGWLTWADMPQTFALANGNFDVDFEDILVAGLGNSVIVHATVTAHAAPVPEPSTMLLLGCGLVGLVGYSRKKLLKR